MHESFLHFLWKFQYFDHAGLCATDGRTIQVVRPGRHNTDAGPDFSQARIGIGGVEWVGQVELHLRSSGWRRHSHQHDAAYENVILHVVWEHDQPVHHPDGTEVPVLVLAPRTPPHLLARYQHLVQNLAPVPCAGQFAGVSSLHKRQALDLALMDRLEGKAAAIRQIYEANGQNWEETAYQVLARTFGFKINAEAMLALAQSLPLKLLHKHGDSLLQMEALLFGQAGLLPATPADGYTEALRREYAFLKQKYRLESTLAASQWKFLRLRPANFPTLRIAQLAALLHKQKFVFSALLALQHPDQVAQCLAAPPSAYWQEHYHFGKASRHTGTLGRDSLHNILTNSAVPLMVAYAGTRTEPQHTERALALLEKLPPEDNKITRLWKDALGLAMENAFDAQAGLELYSRYCTPRRCLACPVGVSLLRPATVA